MTGRRCFWYERKSQGKIGDLREQTKGAGVSGEGFSHFDAERRLFGLRNGDDPISPATFMVGIAVLSFAGKDGTSYPERKKIRERVNVHPKHITEHLTELERRGFLVREIRPGKSTFYRFQPSTKSGEGQNHTLPQKRGVPSTKSGEQPSTKSGEQPYNSTLNSTLKRSIRASCEAPAQSEGKSLTSTDLKDSKINGGYVWKLWLEANQAEGRTVIATGPDTKAAKGLARLVKDGELTEADLRRVMDKFLSDNDPFLVKQGHPLRLLSGRINAYRNESRKEISDAERSAEFERLAKG